MNIVFIGNFKISISFLKELKNIVLTYLYLIK